MSGEHVFKTEFEVEPSTFETEYDSFQVGGGLMKQPKIDEVTLYANKWIGENNFYSQVVSIDSVTEHSQVDLTPDAQQLFVFYEKDLTFVTENDGGVVTVYVIGQKPQNNYTIQVTITEVEV